MIFCGLQKTTLLDYPGHVAATIFTGGCNFRCPFCHNMDIVEKQPLNPISEDEILRFLTKRKGILEGICVTGGEPTLNRELPDFLKKVREIEGANYAIKLDTNGSEPEMLADIINKGLLDYVAMDIKGSEEKYPEICGLSEAARASDHEHGFDAVERVKKSIGIIVDSGIEYEFRTTVVKQFHNEKDMHGIGRLIKGANVIYLQSFKDSEYVKNHSLCAVSKEELENFREILKVYVKEANIRGVD